MHLWELTVRWGRGTAAQALTTQGGGAEPPNPARWRGGGGKEAGPFSKGVGQGQVGSHQCRVRAGWRGRGFQAEQMCGKCRSKGEPGTLEEPQVIGSGQGRQ